MPNKTGFMFCVESEIRATLAGRLKALRLAQNLQQSELAAAAGISRGTVQNLETRAQCSFDSLVRIAMALGVVDDLETVFVRQPTSIAEMEQAALPPRRRASGPRRA